MLQGDRYGLHLRGLGRAALDARAAAGTGLADDAVDLLGGPDHRVGRADLVALAAADADFLLDVGHHRPVVGNLVKIDGNAELRGDGRSQRLAARWADGGRGR